MAKCKRCGRSSDLRLGVCYSCAVRAERKAGMSKGRTASGRIKKGYRLTKSGVKKARKGRKGKR